MRRAIAALLLAAAPLLPAACGGDGGAAAHADAADAPADAPDAADDAPALPEEGPFPDLAVDAATTLAGLRAPVSVVRDARGMPHLYATTLEDLFFAQGYVHAMDRLPEMELSRRSALGTLAELLGTLDDSIIRGDIEARQLLYARVAAEEDALLEPGSKARRIIDAYAAGVNAWLDDLRSGRREMPAPYNLFLKPEAFEDWRPVDSLAIGRLQAHDLSWDGGAEIAMTARAQAIRDTFPADDPDPGIALRAGLMADLHRFAPVDPTFQHPGWAPPAPRGLLPGAASPFRAPGARATKRPRVPEDLLALGLRRAEGRRLLLGRGQAKGASNSFVLGPSRTATGHAILCNDPHLSLDNPPLFHLSHLVLQPGTDDGEIDITGAVFPGIPGHLVGHTRDVAFGVTTASLDRTDVYLEQFTAAADAEGPAPKVPTTLVGTERRPVQRLDEVVRVGSFGVIEREIPFQTLVAEGQRVMVQELTADGPVPLATGPQLSWTWTGFVPTPELQTVVDAMFARDAGELLTAYESFHAANQSVVGADTQGHVWSFTPAQVAVRGPDARTWDPVANPDGTAPWWILPGEADAGWVGWVPSAAGPKTVDPERGFLVTANNDVWGQTADNDPLNDAVYLGWTWDVGLRAGRITRLLDGTGAGSPAAGGAKLGLAETARVQLDTRSGYGERLRDPLVADARKLTEELETPGTWPELTALASAQAGRKAEIEAAVALLEAWDLETPPGVAEGGATPDAAERASAAATLLFNVWLVELGQALLGDELAALGQDFNDDLRERALALVVENAPGTVATLDPATGESVLWDRLDTPGLEETRAQIVAGALVSALDASAGLFAPGTPLEDRVWGEQHRLVLESLLPIPGGYLDLPPPSDPRAGRGYARAGDQRAVNVCNPGLRDLSFGCGTGPIVRFCVDMDPAGPRATMMLPGGQVMNPQSPHFADWLPDWLAGTRRALPFAEAEVRADAGEHLVLLPAP